MIFETQLSAWCNRFRHGRWQNKASSSFLPPKFIFSIFNWLRRRPSFSTRASRTFRWCPFNQGIDGVNFLLLLVVSGDKGNEYLFRPINFLPYTFSISRRSVGVELTMDASSFLRASLCNRIDSFVLSKNTNLLQATFFFFFFFQKKLRRASWPKRSRADWLGCPLRHHPEAGRHLHSRLIFPGQVDIDFFLTSGQTSRLGPFGFFGGNEMWWVLVWRGKIQLKKKGAVRAVGIPSSSAKTVVAIWMVLYVIKSDQRGRLGGLVERNERRYVGKLFFLLLSRPTVASSSATWRYSQ